MRRGIRAGSKNPRTFFTTGSTQGLLSSSRYAPTPRLILFGWVSALYAAVNLKMLRRKLSSITVAPTGYRDCVPVRRGKGDAVPAFCRRCIVNISRPSRRWTATARRTHQQKWFQTSWV